MSEMGEGMIWVGILFMLAFAVLVLFFFVFAQLFRKKEGTFRIRKELFVPGIILLCAAVVLFALSHGIIEGLYRSSPNPEFALEDTPEHRHLRDIGFTCFFASIVLGIIGMIAIVYGVGTEQKEPLNKP